MLPHWATTAGLMASPRIQALLRLQEAADLIDAIGCFDAPLSVAISRALLRHTSRRMFDARIALALGRNRDLIAGLTRPRLPRCLRRSIACWPTRR
jgi:hypothetical protein